MLKNLEILISPAELTMAGETGGDREEPSPPGPINFISWVGPDIYQNGPFLLLLDCFFFSNFNSCIGGFGPIASLKDPFPRGPPRPSSPTSRIISPALVLTHASDKFEFTTKECNAELTKKCGAERRLRGEGPNVGVALAKLVWHLPHRPYDILQSPPMLPDIQGDLKKNVTPSFQVK